MNELVQKIEAQLEQVEKDLAEFKETGYWRIDNTVQQNRW